jgi:hypothetical protein
MGQAGVAGDGIGCGGFVGVSHVSGAVGAVDANDIETSSPSALKLAQRVGGDVFETAGTTSDR